MNLNSAAVSLRFTVASMAASFFVLLILRLLSFVYGGSHHSSESSIGRRWKPGLICGGDVVIYTHSGESFLEDQVVGVGGSGDILSRIIVDLPSVYSYYAPEVSKSVFPGGPAGFARVKDGFVYEIESAWLRAFLFRLGILDTVALPPAKDYLDVIGGNYKRKVIVSLSRLKRGVDAAGLGNVLHINVGMDHATPPLDAFSKERHLYCR